MKLARLSLPIRLLRRDDGQIQNRTSEKRIVIAKCANPVNQDI